MRIHELFDIGDNMRWENLTCFVISFGSGFYLENGFSNSVQFIGDFLSLLIKYGTFNHSTLVFKNDFQILVLDLSDLRSTLEASIFSDFLLTFATAIILELFDEIYSHQRNRVIFMNRFTGFMNLINVSDFVNVWNISVKHVVITIESLWIWWSFSQFLNFTVNCGNESNGLMRGCPYSES